MSERDLQTIIQKLKSTHDYSEATSLLSRAKITLLKLRALTPQPKTSPSILVAAREVFELGALLSIRAKDADSFTRYVHQLTPFYELPASLFSASGSGSASATASGAASGGSSGEKNKITGLYLLLLLTQGDYSGFHTELESLESRAGESVSVERDRYIGYPIKLERWLMEGAYDLVWKAMASNEVPSEEYGVFSEIISSRIRNEIASCSEIAYPSLPISSTKNLLFLDSEGAVIQFAQSRGWLVRDGFIYFPKQSQKAGLTGEDGSEKEMSEIAIENTLGYARELETIV